MNSTMATMRLPLVILMISFFFFFFFIVHGSHQVSGDRIRKLQKFKAAFIRRDSVPPPTAPPGSSNSREFYVTSYGADPSGKADSTDAILAAISDACKAQTQGILMAGINNLGGARINLAGGHYIVRRPLKLPAAGLGNLMIHGGTLQASDDFPSDGYLIDLSSSTNSGEYIYEFITLRDLMLDCNYKASAIKVANSLRTSIDNCYIAHFTTDGILVQGGHETYIRNSFLGQHITAGADRGERNFSGTAITLNGNDNAVTDVVIFSAAVGILISGQANMITGVHCYNKATGFGGVGIYVKLPGLSQTRIANSYMDYTGIVAEDPVQLEIVDSFFLGDAFITLKSVNGIVSGVNIVDNMFSGSGNGVEIVHLDESKGGFKKIDQVVVDRNSVNGMNVRSTVGRGSVAGNGTTWTVDFNPVLLFPNRISNVQYSLVANGGGFPNHVLRNVTGNRVTVEADAQVPATVFVSVDQV